MKGIFKKRKNKKRVLERAFRDQKKVKEKEEENNNKK